MVALMSEDRGLTRGLMAAPWLEGALEGPFCSERPAARHTKECEGSESDEEADVSSDVRLLDGVPRPAGPHVRSDWACPCAP